MTKAKLEGLFVDELERLQPTPGYMRLVKERVLRAWQQRKAEVGDEAADAERKAKAIQQKLDRLDEAFLYAQTIDLDDATSGNGQAAPGAHARADRPPLRRAREIRRGGHPGVRRTRFAARRRTCGCRPRSNQKQRLQQLFFPDGVAFDGNRFVRTAVTAPFFSYLAPVESADEKVVSRNKNRTDVPPALGGNDLEVGEISAGGIAHPDSDQALLAVAQLVDGQAGFFRIADKDAHLRARDNHAGMEPGVRIRHGFDRLFGTCPGVSARSFCHG